MIKRSLISIYFLFITSCSINQLSISDVKFTPEKISKGEKLLLTVKVEDSEKIISNIMGVLRRDKSYKFELNDDGKSGDKNPNDGIWSLEYQIPNNAPARTYTVDFYAYDKDGKKIMKIEEDGSKNHLSAVASVRVVR